MACSVLSQPDWITCWQRSERRPAGDESLARRRFTAAPRRGVGPALAAQSAPPRRTPPPPRARQSSGRAGPPAPAGVRRGRGRPGGEQAGGRRLHPHAACKQHPPTPSVRAITLVASSARSNCTKMRTAWSAGNPGSVASKISTLAGGGRERRSDGRERQGVRACQAQGAGQLWAAAAPAQAVLHAGCPAALVAASLRSSAHLVTWPCLEHSSPTSLSRSASTSPGPICGTVQCSALQRSGVRPCQGAS